MVNSSDLSSKIQNLINQGEIILRSFEIDRNQIEHQNHTITDDLTSIIVGEAAGYFEVPGLKRLSKKYTRDYLRKQRAEQKQQLESQQLGRCKMWLNSIEEFLKNLSVKNSTLTIEGNSHILLKKISRLHQYKKPETMVKHGIGILKEIQNMPLIYNSDIDTTLTWDKEAYTILRDLETNLRQCIQSNLSSITSNWWRERIPQDVRSRAEERKAKNENQWPWYSNKAHDLISYVDFNDYLKIITKKDNWRDVFSQLFKDKDIISAKLRELEPIRNAIAHNRKIGSYEILKLKLHARDILLCIK